MHNCEQAFESLEINYFGDVNRIVAEQMAYILEFNG